MDTAYLINVKGRVTGVGFRYSALDKAKEFKNLTGYVRNRCEGEVEAVVQGPVEETEQMIEWFRRGPDWARVDNFSYSKVPLDKSYTYFRIR
jgi:acylphosphatase